MEKKYYDLIVDIIKKHKKYANYESILDAIVEDVYEHSKVVIETIEDEAVLSEYLSKIVSTSMVTVPRRLNLVDRKSKSVDITAIINLQNSEAVAVQANEQSDFLDSEEQIEDFSEEKSEFNGEDLPEDDLSNEDEVVQEEVLSQVDFFNEDENLENADQAIDAEVDKFTYETVDESLVEKMINGVSSSSQELQSDVEEELQEDEYEELENLEIIDSFEVDVESEEKEFLEDEECLLEPVDDIMEEDAKLELSNSEPEVESENLVEQSLEEELILVDCEDELYQEELIDDKNQNNIVSVDEQGVDIFDDRFSCFEFEPTIEGFNSELVCETLLRLSQDYPQKNILKVCELKYYQNKTIEEISKIVGISKEMVLDILNDIISAIEG